MKPLFCPNCRMRLEPSKNLNNPNFVIGGTILLRCDNCNKDGKGNPKGVLKIKPKQTTKNNLVDDGFE